MNDYRLLLRGSKLTILTQHPSSKKGKFIVFLLFVLTLVTSGSTYAFVTGDLDLNFNTVFATNSGGGESGGGGGGGGSNDGSGNNGGGGRAAHQIHRHQIHNHRTRRSMS